MAEGGAPSLTPLESELLSYGTDDWSALWEALGLIRRLFPNMSESERKESARATLLKLIDQGLLFICFFKHTGNKEVRIPPDKVVELIEDEANWEPTSSGEWHIRFAATEKGEQVYFALPPL